MIYEQHYLLSTSSMPRYLAINFKTSQPMCPEALNGRYTLPFPRTNSRNSSEGFPYAKNSLVGSPILLLCCPLRMHLGICLSSTSHLQTPYSLPARRHVKNRIFQPLQHPYSGFVVATFDPWEFVEDSSQSTVIPLSFRPRNQAIFPPRSVSRWHS